MPVMASPRKITRRTRKQNVQATIDAERESLLWTSPVTGRDLASICHDGRFWTPASGTVKPFYRVCLDVFREQLQVPTAHRDWHVIGQVFDIARRRGHHNVAVVAFETVELDLEAERETNVAINTSGRRRSQLTKYKE